MFCDADGQLCPGGVDMNGCYEGDYCAPSHLGKSNSAIFTHFILMLPLFCNYYSFTF